MQMSEHGRKLVEQWEGFQPKVYRDIAGLPTIGVGHLLTKDELTSGKIIINGAAVRYTDGLTGQQIDDLLSQDLEEPEQVVNDNVEVALNQNQFDALISFTFNVGSMAFVNSTLLRLLNQGQYDQTPDQLRRWIHSGGQIAQGLIHRRENEIKLWNGEK